MICHHPAEADSQSAQVVGPIGPGELIAEDFHALTAYEYRKRVSPIVTALTEILDSIESYDE